jgi:hypothetical protein
LYLLLSLEEVVLVQMEIMEMLEMLVMEIPELVVVQILEDTLVAVEAALAAVVAWVVMITLLEYLHLDLHNLELPDIKEVTIMVFKIVVQDLVEMVELVVKMVIPLVAVAILATQERSAILEIQTLH